MRSISSEVQEIVSPLKTERNNREAKSEMSLPR
jgi:hypothetical protein